MFSIRIVTISPGFLLQPNGKLRSLPGSRHPLSAPGSGAAQILFSPDGRTLVVTERATNKIVTFSVNRQGVPTDRKVFDSPGPTPFGFAFTRGRHMLVAEAAGGAPGVSSVSSYRLRRDGSLQLLERSLPTLQTASCWLAISPDGQYVYTANSGSNNVSGLRLSGNGELTLLTPDGSAGDVGAGSVPIDIAFTQHGEYMNVLGGGNGTLTTFKVGAAGQLQHVDTISGLPISTNGLVAL